MEPSSTSSFKQFARAHLLPWLAFTCAVALAADALCVHVLIPRGTSGRIQRLLRTQNAEEVGIFGSSRAEENYAPDLLGPHVYDYGLSGTAFEVTQVLLDAELAKPKRSPIIVNFDFDFFRPDIGDPTAYIPYYDVAGFRALMQQAGAARYYYAVPGVRFIGTYEVYLRGFVESFGSPTKTIVRGAALTTSPITREQFLASVEQRRALHEDFVVPHDMDERFQALLSRRTDRKIIVIVGPYHRSMYEAFAGVAKVRAYLARLEQLHPNVVTLYFDGSQLDDSLFQDTSHLNATGAFQFTRELHQRLVERGIAL